MPESTRDERERVLRDLLGITGWDAWESGALELAFPVVPRSFVEEARKVSPGNDAMVAAIADAMDAADADLAAFLSDEASVTTGGEASHG